MLTLLFDGIAYGMLLFVLSVGLAVTMGLMNFINLAHGAFAMLGGYLTVVLMQRHGVPFLVCLPIAFVVPALVGALLERTVYRPLYGRPHLDHVLVAEDVDRPVVREYADRLDVHHASEGAPSNRADVSGRSPARCG